jgi:hypothetical protein
LFCFVIDAFFSLGDFGDARVVTSRASSGSGSGFALLSSVSSKTRVERERVVDEREKGGEGDERRRRLASVSVPRRSAFGEPESVGIRLERVLKRVFAAAGVRAAARVNSAAAAAAPASASRAATSAADAE